MVTAQNSTDFQHIFGFAPTPISTKDGVPTYTDAQVELVNQQLTDRANAFLRMCMEQETLQHEKMPVLTPVTAGWMTHHTNAISRIGVLVADRKKGFWFAHRKAAEKSFPVKSKVGEYVTGDLQFLKVHPEINEPEA